MPRPLVLIKFSNQYKQLCLLRRRTGQRPDVLQDGLGVDFGDALGQRLLLFRAFGRMQDDLDTQRPLSMAL